MYLKTFVKLKLPNGGHAFVDPMAVSSVRDAGSRSRDCKLRFVGDGSRSLLVEGDAESVQRQLLAAIPEKPRGFSDDG